MSANGGGLPPLPKSLSGLLNFSRESLSRAEASLGFKSGILGSGSVGGVNNAGATAGGGSTSRGPTDRGSSSSSSGYVSSSSTASPSVVAKENVAPSTMPAPTATLPVPPIKQPPQQHLQHPTSGFQQYSSVKSDVRPSPSPSPFRPIQSPGPRAYQVSFFQLTPTKCVTDLHLQNDNYFKSLLTSFVARQQVVKIGSTLKPNHHSQV